MSIFLNETPPATHLIYLRQIQGRSQLIYSITLFSLGALLFALPFIYTNIHVKGHGTLQSKAGKVSLIAPVSGRVVQVGMKNNQRVTKGRTLLVIDASLPLQQRAWLLARRQQTDTKLEDLKTLIEQLSAGKGWKKNPLKTKLYEAGWKQYLARINPATNVLEQAERIYIRYQTLYQKKVVSLAEFEQNLFNYNQAQDALELINKEYISRWQTEALQYQNELQELKYQLAQLSEQAKPYSLKAVISGSVQNLAGIYPGNDLIAGQHLAEISPEGPLLAYCYVDPAGIGFIKNGQAVQLRIDALNYNEWGSLNGRVIAIGDDTITWHQMPYYQVVCRLDKNYLQLKSGYRTLLKKGMSFTASFKIARRSLFQLLYDKAADWVNLSAQP